MTVKELIAKLSKLPQDVEFVAWNDEREVYVGVDAPQAVILAKNEHDELIDAGYRNLEHKTYVTVGLQG
jgi:hypothetical protein